MEPSIEQASAILDQALIFYAGGQTDEGSQQIASAAAVLHEIQLTPAEPKAEPAGSQLIVEFLALTGGTSPPDTLQPATVEPAGKAALAVAA